MSIDAPQDEPDVRENPPRYRNQAARRVLRVLAAVADAQDSFGVTELARLLSMSKNMVHRALTTLADDGYVTRDPAGRYQIGYRVLTLGPSDDGEFDIGLLSRPCLEGLHALTGESVYLSIIVGGARVTIDEILPPGPRVLRSLRGAPVALHCTKMSRVLLAHLRDAEIEAYLDAATPLACAMRFPDPASETPDGVRGDIADIRRHENVLWRNPHLSSAAYAIFPVLGEDNRPHGIVTVGGPRERFDIPDIQSRLPELLAVLAPLRQHARLFPAPPLVLDEQP